MIKFCLGLNIFFELIIHIKLKYYLLLKFKITVLIIQKYQIFTQ